MHIKYSLVVCVTISGTINLHCHTHPQGYFQAPFASFMTSPWTKLFK